MSVDPFGLLVVDKPAGPSSHDVVARVRRGTGIRKVGHTGTLDPRASGVLVICVGPATRLSEYLISSDKEYRARIRFGSATDTYDSEGSETERTGRSPERGDLESILRRLQGPAMQTPPAYSAVKVSGKRAYRRARAGEDLQLNPRPVELYSLEIVSYEPPDLVLDVHCSAGTYLRSLAHDLGQLAGTGAYLADLRRTRAGNFDLSDAVSLGKLEDGFESGAWEQWLIPAAQALPDFPVVNLDDMQLSAVISGRRIPSDEPAQGLVRGLDRRGRLVAILSAVPGSDQWQPAKVFPRRADRDASEVN